MGILLGILELIKVGIIYSFIFLFNNGISIIFTIISFFALLSGNVTSFFFALVPAWVTGLIFFLAMKDEKFKE